MQRFYFQHSFQFKFSFFRFQMSVTVSMGSRTYEFKNGKEKKDKDESLTNNNHNAKERAVRIMEPNETITKIRKPDRAHLKKLHQRPSMIQLIRKSIEEGEEDTCYLDKYSRIVFPISYTIFLGIYFGIYMVRWENLSLANGDQQQ